MFTLTAGMQNSELNNRLLEILIQPVKFLQVLWIHVETIYLCGNGDRMAVSVVSAVLQGRRDGSGVKDREHALKTLCKNSLLSEAENTESNMFLDQPHLLFKKSR